MNIQNHETYDKIKFAERLKVVAMNDGGEELPQKLEEEKKICREEVKRLRVAMVVVMKQLNVAMLHVGSFVVTDGDGRGGGERRGDDATIHVALYYFMFIKWNSTTQCVLFFFSNSSTHPMFLNPHISKVIKLLT